MILLHRFYNTLSLIVVVILIKIVFSLAIETTEIVVPWANSSSFGAEIAKPGKVSVCFMRAAPLNDRRLGFSMKVSGS